MVKLQLLGPTRLTDADGEEVTAVVTHRKELALLSYLALQEPWTFCRRETLAGLLWPESSESRARASLSVAVHHLRSLIGRRVLLGRGSEEIGIDPDRLWVDVRAFLEAVEAGDLRQAGTLYRGDLLDGFHVSGATEFINWLEGERRRLRLAALNGLIDLADSMIDSDADQACTWARRATVLAPYDQKAHACLARALARSSHHVEALRVLGQLEDRLRGDLDLEPCAEIRALEKRLRAPGDEASVVLAERVDRGASGSDSLTDGSATGVGAESSEQVAERERVSTGPDGSKPAPAQWSDDVADVERGPTELDRRPSRHRWGLAAAGVVLLLTVPPYIVSRTGPEPIPRRLQVSLPESTPLSEPGAARLLDDGSGVVYAGPDDARDGTRLWLFRWSSPASTQATPVPGTLGVVHFDPSPDGSGVALIAGDTLRVQPFEAAGSRILVAGGVRCCVRWLEDGWVYFTASDGGLRRVSEEGLVVDVLSSSDDVSVMHAWATPLPGGRHYAIEVTTYFGFGSSVALLDANTGQATAVVDGRYPFFAGRLFFSSRDGTQLLAAELDGSALGEAAIVLDDMTPNYDEERGGSYDFSSAGDLFYAAGGFTSADTEVPVWVTRDGQSTPVSSRLASLGHTFREVRLSPDERYIAFRFATDLYVGELPDGPFQRVTRDGTLNRNPWWTPDGTGIYYRSDRLAPTVDAEIFRVRVDGLGEPERLGLPCPMATPIPDGSGWICRTRNDRPDGGNLVLRSTSPDTQPVDLVATNATEGQGVPSPNSRWFAYSTDIDGEREVYVAALPDPTASRQVRVSDAGGHSPAWSPSTNELFYIGEDGGMWAVRYVQGDEFRIVDRTRLFDASGYRFDTFSTPHVYDVTDDAQRFVMVPLRSLQADPHRNVLIVNLEAAVGSLR